MTRKDYIIIAKALNQAAKVHIENNDLYQRGKHVGVLVAAEIIADSLLTDNPNFNRKLFMDAVKGK